MEIKLDLTLMDYEGNVLRHPKSNDPWTVGLVLLTMAMEPSPAGSSYSQEEQVERYRTGQTIYAALKANEVFVRIPDEMIAKLRADIARCFGPILAGQMIILLS